jgi:lipoate-protein ligase A
VDEPDCRVTARGEQEWIAGALRSPVTAPALRVWAYGAAAVVLGCSRRPTPRMSVRASAAGVDLCARQTGGGAVLAGPWMLGASIVLPVGHPLVVGSIPLSFRWLGRAHASWLQSIGVAAHAVPCPAAPPDPGLSWACFARLSHWEAEVDGRKIVGLAQARRRNGVVFSAATLIAPPPWELLCDVLAEPRSQAAALARRTSSCKQLLGDTAPPGALVRSLLAHLSEAVAASERRCPAADTYRSATPPCRNPTIRAGASSTS